MTIDLYAKAQNLLETLANSIHDRENKPIEPFFFSVNEVVAAEKWLHGFIEEMHNNSPQI